MKTRIRRKRTELFYEFVRKEYERLCEIKENGHSKYTQGYIIAKIAERHFRSERTIENIIYHRVG